MLDAQYVLNHFLKQLRDRFNNRPVDDAQRLGLKDLVTLLTTKAKKLQERASQEDDQEDDQDDDHDDDEENDWDGLAFVAV